MVKWDPAHVTSRVKFIVCKPSFRSVDLRVSQARSTFFDFFWPDTQKKNKNKNKKKPKKTTTKKPFPLATLIPKTMGCIGLACTWLALEKLIFALSSDIRNHYHYACHH